MRFVYWSLVPITAMGLSDFADLRYEESMKYPKKAAKGDLAVGGSLGALLNRSIRLCQAEISKQAQGLRKRAELENAVLPELQSLLNGIEENRLPPQSQRRQESLVCARTIWG